MEQKHRELEFFCRQINGLLIAIYLSAAGNESIRAEYFFVAADRRVVDPTRDGFDSCQQFMTSHRLDQVIVGPRIERTDNICFCIAYVGEKHRRDDLRLRFQELQHLQPGHIGQYPIEQKRLKTFERRVTEQGRA